MGILSAVIGTVAGAIFGSSSKSGKQVGYKETDLGKSGISGEFFIGKGLRKPKSSNLRSANVLKPTFYSFDAKVAAAQKDLENQDTIKNTRYAKNLSSAISNIG
jgi:hypothetical protein|tara:strand:+ start:110 stop:421 length:312 start_codon:yes stop_codon:yes gene_type:complete